MKTQFPMICRIVVVSLLAAALQACAPEPSSSILEGQVRLADDAPVPEGARIEVRVFENGQIVGQRLVRTAATEAPYEFALAIVPDPDAAPWQLHGEMIDADGNVIKHTPQPTPVPNRIGSHDIGTVVLQPVAVDEPVVEEPAVDEPVEVDPDELLEDEAHDEDHDEPENDDAEASAEQDGNST